MPSTAALCWASSRENAYADAGGGDPASGGTYSDAAANRYRRNAAFDVRPGRIFDAAGAAGVRAFFAAHPHCGIPAAGNPSHRKGPAERAAQYGAGMQRRRIHCRLSLVTAGTLLMACPYSVSLLRYFHRGPAAAQCRAWLSCKRPRLQYNGSGTSADLEAAPPLHHTVYAANCGGIPLLLEAVASYAAPAPGRLGGEPPGLWDFHPVLRNRLRPSSPLLKRCTY